MYTWYKYPSSTIDPILDHRSTSTIDHHQWTTANTSTVANEYQRLRKLLNCPLHTTETPANPSTPLVKFCRIVRHKLGNLVSQDIRYPVDCANNSVTTSTPLDEGRNTAQASFRETLNYDKHWSNLTPNWRAFFFFHKTSTKEYQNKTIINIREMIRNGVARQQSEYTSVQHLCISSSLCSMLHRNSTFQIESVIHTSQSNPTRAQRR
jgi:hypothetical protein